jgi:cobalt-zinc-cadmium efflux system outer membrane protein
MSGSRGKPINSRNRRRPLKAKGRILKSRNTIFFAASVVLSCAAFVDSAFGQVAARPSKITLDQAIELAIQHNHGLLAARTTILQNQALEVQANLRPNPTFFADWEYLPLSSPAGIGFLDYLHDSTEGDVGASYLFERGDKRQHRLEAAQDATAVTRSTVSDNERTLAFQVGQLYINAELAQSTLELARLDLKSFQQTIDISKRQYEIGAMDENDFLQIRLQLVQFQTDVEQAELSKAQALSDLRQQLGYESVPAEYDIADELEYRPVAVELEDLQATALQNRPDLRAAQQGITAANSQYTLAKANGKQDYTLQANYSHVNSISAFSFSFSIPLPIFDRNQGTIAQTHYAIAQAQEQKNLTNGQVLTDVRDAYLGVQFNDRVVKLYRSGTLDDNKRSRDISEYAYRHGATPLLNFLVAERNYRAVELAYRQAVASYVTSVEQLRQAVGSRSLP